MLTVTDNASTEIRNLIANNPEVSADAGVRIAPTPAGDNLALTLVPTPADGDTVVDGDGARVFIEPTAAQLLDDKTLDAGVDPQGQVQFALQG